MDVLRALRDEERGPTQIMYKANLSWLVLRGLLNDFIAKEIVVEKKVGGRARYIITERGRNILDAYMMVINEMEAISGNFAEAAGFEGRDAF